MRSSPSRTVRSSPWRRASVRSSSRGDRSATRTSSAPSSTRAPQWCLLAADISATDVIAEPRPPTRGAVWLVAPLTAFALVALTVGLLARERFDPNKGYFQLFFSDTLHLKAWLATAVVALAISQLFT